MKIRPLLRNARHRAVVRLVCKAC